MKEKKFVLLRTLWSDEGDDDPELAEEGWWPGGDDWWWPCFEEERKVDWTGRWAVEDQGERMELEGHRPQCRVEGERLDVREE